EHVEGDETNVLSGIDDHVIVVVPETNERVGQNVLSADLTRERLRHPTQQDVGRSQVEVFANGQDDVTKNRGAFAGLLDKHLVHGPRGMQRIGQKSERGAPTRVRVDGQDLS